MGLRKLAGRFVLTLGLLGLMVILLALAWLASNNRWVDAPPQPRPPSLQAQQPKAEAAGNVFFDLAGLFAMPEESISARGQAVWAADGGDGDAALRRPSLEAAKDPLSSCSWQRQDCLALWTQDSAALKARLQEQSLLLGRCAAIADDLAAGRRVFEEPVPVARAEVRRLSDQFFARPVASHARGSTSCLRGFQMQAALAQQQADPAALLQALRRGQALVQAQLNGAQTLIAHVLAWKGASQQQRLAAGLLARAPEQAVALSGFFGPLPARALDATTWMAAESQNGQGILEMSRLCSRTPDFDPKAAQPVAELLERGSAWAEFKCKFGLMPQRTVQEFDAWWLDKLQQAARAGPEALAGAVPEAAPAPSLWSWPWRNTLGHVLFEVAKPAYSGYPAKQADLLLSHRASQLVLALAQTPVAPSERGAWLAAQALSPAQGARLKISADGRTLVLQPWEASGSNEAGDAMLNWPLPMP